MRETKQEMITQQGNKGISPFYAKFSESRDNSIGEKTHIEKAGMKWESVETDHFTINWIPGTERFAVPVLNSIEKIYAALISYMPKQQTDEKVSLWITQFDEQHKRIQESNGKEHPLFVNNMDIVTKSDIYLRPRQGQYDLVNSATHEETHILYYRTGLSGEHKNWPYIGEYLCWYFQELIETEGNITINSDAKKYSQRDTYLYLITNTTFSLSELTSNNFRLVNPKDPLFQTNGNILVSFYNFLEIQYGTEKFKDFLWSMMNDENVNLSDAVYAAYDRDLLSFDDEWREFYNLPPKESTNPIVRYAKRILRALNRKR